MTIHDFYSMKQNKQKISMITCYDYWSAQIIDQTNIDCILVGDSASMVMHGHDSTLPISVETMALHTSAVVRGAPHKFIVGDLPFLSYRKDLTTNVEAAEKLMKAGAHAVKLEGSQGNLELIKHLVTSGIPVMGHLGLTPQSVHQLGGFKVQGRGVQKQEQLIQECLDLEQAGCFAIVLECIPSALAEKITAALNIITIGIGAGPFTDGQVLVLQDMLGMNPNFKPKFLRKYMDGFASFTKAFNDYDKDVKSQNFPNIQETYES